MKTFVYIALIGIHCFSGQPGEAMDLTPEDTGNFVRCYIAQHFGTKISYRDLKGIATVAGLVSGVGKPSREAMRGHVQLVDWFERNWGVIYPFLSLIRVTDNAHYEIGASSAFQNGAAGSEFTLENPDIGAALTPDPARARALIDEALSPFPPERRLHVLRGTARQLSRCLSIPLTMADGHDMDTLTAWCRQYWPSVGARLAVAASEYEGEMILKALSGNSPRPWPLETYERVCSEAAGAGIPYLPHGLGTATFSDLGRHLGQNSATVMADRTRRRAEQGTAPARDDVFD